MNLKGFNLAPFNILDNEWALLTAGNKDNFNTMTISWGGFGTIWNIPTATVYVRSNRYTYKFMEENEYFTISFFDKKFKKDLSVLGSKSGRDLDKLSLTKLTPHVLDNAISFNEANLTIVCKKMFFQDLDVKNINNKCVPQSEIERFYTKEPAHRMYLGEVVDIIDKRK